MSVAIVYLSGKGWVAERAAELSGLITDDVTLINLKDRSAGQVDLLAFDRVVILGAVRMGRFPGKLKRYCFKNEALLLKKKISFAYACLEEDEGKKNAYLLSAFPPSLVKGAFAKVWIGGRIRLSDYGWIQQKMLAPLVKDDVIEKKLSENIEVLAGMINEKL
ncbi:MAG: hypothetical protein JEY99_06785 [Spirochaetales bacterium]|nr:hypothetical protein [Spirochaetales bacterium]